MLFFKGKAKDLLKVVNVKKKQDKNMRVIDFVKIYRKGVKL